MKIPYDFILEELYPLQLKYKKMFGVDAFYYEKKIVFALRKSDVNSHDNGVWIATRIEHHKQLKGAIKDLRIIKDFGPKTWMLLPEDSDFFEEGAIKITELIKQHSDLIGNIPKPKKKR